MRIPLPALYGALGAAAIAYLAWLSITVIQLDAQVAGLVVEKEWLWSIVKNETPTTTASARP